MIWTKSAAIIPSNNGSRRTGVFIDICGRSSPSWDIGHDGVGARDARNGKHDRARELECPVVETGGIPRWVKSWSVPIFTTKKKTGKMSDGDQQLRFA